MRPQARDALESVLDAGLGNPTGGHALARAARRCLDESRERLAALAGCAPGEVVFTSGGTEADNLAVLGSAEACQGRALCAATDHPAVLEAVKRTGGEAVAVDAGGAVEPAALADALERLAPVSVVSLALVNNETGVIADLGPAAEVVARHGHGAVLHTDAAQALSWLDVATAAAPADLVTLSAHKCGGPVGTGALVVRGAARLAPRALGGGQERDRRSGTPDVAGAASFAAAAELAAAERGRLGARVAAWRDELLDGITASVPGALVTAAQARAVPGRLAAGWAHLCLPRVRSETLLLALEHDHAVLASAASSCASGAQQRSHVLAAMGVPPAAAAGSLRLSMGWSTTAADVAAAALAVPVAARRLAGAAVGGVGV